MYGEIAISEVSSRAARKVMLVVEVGFNFLDVTIDEAAGHRRSGQTSLH
jgi:hypothetical protein